MNRVSVIHCHLHVNMIQTIFWLVNKLFIQVNLSENDVDLSYFTTSRFYDVWIEFYVDLSTKHVLT